MTGYQCPLCDWASSDPAEIYGHGIEQHPATIGRSGSIPDQLRLIPGLVAEAELIRGHRYRDGSTVAARSVPGSRVIAELDLVDFAAAPDSDYPGRPLTQLVECSRICWEAAPVEVRTGRAPEPPCTITSEATWLASFYPDADPYLDEADRAWIAATVAGIVAALMVATSTRYTPVFKCPGCGENLIDAAGGWLWCRACGTEYPGPARLYRQWRDKPPMSTSEIAQALNINPNRIHKWCFRGLLSPARKEGQISYWYPIDVIELLWPDAKETTAA